MSLTIVTVAYNSATALRDLVPTVPSDVDFVVVDNASEDDSVDVARAGGARIVVRSTNDGFGTACNAGAATSEADWLLFLNPDARLEPDSLERLLEGADRHPQAGAFNPTIIRGDGTRFARHRNRLLPDVPPTQWSDDDFEVPNLSGSALLCRRDVFETVGGFDENIFLYFEDDDLSLRLRREAGPLVYLSGPVVHHDGGGSSEDTANGYFAAKHMTRSRAYVERKHGLRFARTRLWIKALGRVVDHRVLSDAARREEALGMVAGLAERR